MNLHITEEWLRKMADQEANGIISVGGLAARVEAASQAIPSPTTERSALAQLVEWQRRKLRLTVESLAERSDVEVEEVLAIERGDGVPEPRTVFKLAQTLNLPPDKLMHLAGLVINRDPRLERAAVRFAARSAPIEVLTPEQVTALEEFVQTLAD